MTDAVILAIDTSTFTASVAVYAGRVLAETTWVSGRRHSAELLPAVEDTVKRAGSEKAELTAIAVAAGPGSYSGLRVGISTAMALAMALEVPVVQVPTLDAIAWAQLAESSGPSERRPAIRPAVDVGRGRFATARLRSAHDELEHETRIESMGLQQLLDLAAVERSLLVVDLDGESRGSIEHQYGGLVHLASPAASARRAGFIAELAAIKIRRGELAGDLSVEPIYLHS